MTRPPYRPPAPQAIAWVLERCGAEDVVRVERLVGGTTAAVDRLVLGQRGRGSMRVVLRRWTDPAPWTDGLVEREAAALSALASTAVPAPRLLAADPSGARAGLRCLLMSELPGSAILAPAGSDHWLRRLARAHATIHAVEPTLTARSPGWFEPDADRTWISDAGLRRDAEDAAMTARPDGVFVHGDFQPFNVLWRDATVSAVVDWPNAGIGTRGIDVGHCMLNLAVLDSTEAALAYLGHYEAVAGVRVDRAALLRALLVWDPTWQQLITVQTAGRADVDAAGMPARVTETLRRILDSDIAGGV